MVDGPNGHRERDEGQEEGEEEGVGDAPGFRVPDFLPLHGADVQVEVGPEEDEEGAVG